MEEDLVAYLLATPAVINAVGVNVYWIRAPQKVSKPYVVMYRVAGARDTTMDGASGLVATRVQFDCWAEKTLTLFAVARAIETALSGLRFDQGSTEFRGCFLDAERDAYDDTTTPDKLFGKSLDFTIWHRRA
jgi:hypothetical protein